MVNKHEQVIYSLTNKMIFRQYIGSTKDFRNRKINHFSMLRNHHHWVEQLQHDFDLFGEDCFYFSILENVDGLSEEKRVEKEQKWIDLLHPVYNINPIAGRFTVGRVVEKSSIEKIRKFFTGRKQSPEVIARRVATMTKNGKHHLKRLTPEQKRHLSEINTGERNPNWGLHRSDETKRKQSEAIGKYYVGAISPTGEIFAPIHNMSKFCIEHRLCVSNMVALMHGRIKSSLGWKRFEPKSGAARGANI